MRGSNGPSLPRAASTVSAEDEASVFGAAKAREVATPFMGEVRRAVDRVLAAGHKAGGFSAHGGAATKLRMLAAEGVPQGDTRSLFDGA